ncbi:MAG: acetoin catabolism protein [Thermomicrobiales bacterium]|nr:acetoin catabolism protein [Thermomicrobiales bacterium]MCD6057482.1 acetoin catabolism protein [Thermomicrobiales bacterium]
MTERTLVGIIANPASGKDIRRLVAHGSTFDNNEKINIVRRVLLGLDAARVSEVAYLPDSYGIVERAAAAAAPRLTITPLSMPVVGHASDSTEAAERLRDLGAAAIVTLGGDGTNRAVAKGCGDVPLLPLSTGTNNVFPRVVEGTLAGIAAGLIATGVARNTPGLPRVIRRAPRLEVWIDGTTADSALIDVVASSQSWIGARALWEPVHLREIVLSRICASVIGIASLGGALFPRACSSCSGAWIAVGESATAPRTVTIPIAPGLLRSVPIATAELLDHGATVNFRGGPCTLAFDGEREIEVQDSNVQISVRLDPRGPRVIDVDAALAAGAAAGTFVTARDHQVNLAWA